MGIAKGAVKVLLKELSRRPFRGQVLTLGRQDIFISYDVLQKIAEEFGVELSKPESIMLSHKPELAAKGFISDDCLFQSLGFSTFKTLDYSDYESAHYIFDLNKSEIPEYLCEAFDVIIDGGTIEHVFHIPSALNNIYKMLRYEGRIIHLSPSSNYMDHGFYMFSPTLFENFYTTNKFEINNIQLIRHTQHPDDDPWEISNYQSGCLDNGVSFGGLDDGMYAIICIATKTKNSTGHIIPQQRIYVYDIWKVQERQQDSRITIEKTDSFFSYLRSSNLTSAIKRFPFLFLVLQLFAKLFRSIFRILKKLSLSISRVRLSCRPPKGLGLKIVDRY
jgi:hypothetical protein